MNKKKIAILGAVIVVIVLLIVAIVLSNDSTKNGENKTTTAVVTVNPETAVSAVSDKETGSEESYDTSAVETENDSEEIVTNKTYGDNQGDNYAIDIFTDEAVENKTKSDSETTKKTKNNKKSNSNNEKTTKKDKNNANSDDGWTDFY